MPFDGPTLADLIFEQCEQRATHPALEFEGEVWSYAELAAAVSQLALCIAGVGKPGDRVAVLARNRLEYVALLYAVPAAGRILVSLNARLSAVELRDQLERSGSSLIFGETTLLDSLGIDPDLKARCEIVDFDEGYVDWLSRPTGAELPELDGTEPAWLLFTSGTTGKPKGAILTHRSLLAGLVSAQQGRPVLAEDRYLYCFPLFHVSAHNVLLQHGQGATVLLVPGFEAGEVLEACRRRGVSTLSLAPTMLAMLLEHPEYAPADLSGLRTIGYGASAMPVDLLLRTARDTEVGFSGGYGMTELSGSISFLDVEAHHKALEGDAELLASVGKPVSGVEIVLVDDEGNVVVSGDRGEILVRGNQVMKGYWDDPVATASAMQRGWLRTGDIGSFDASGHLYIVDRKKDMILTGGENVASREVEEVLAKHPHVNTAAVVGLPDQRWGEKVCALVVPSQGVVPDVEALLEFCRERLARFKSPKIIAVAEIMPVNANGKIDKRQVREYLLKDLTGLE